MGHVAVTGSEAGIGPAIRMQLKSAGRTVIGVDLPGSGAEIEADLGTLDRRQQAIQVVLEQCGGSLDGLVCIPRTRARARLPRRRTELLRDRRAPERVSGMPSVWGNQPAAVVNVSGALLITPGIPEDAVEAIVWPELMREPR